MAISLITAPTAEPITPEDVMQHCRVDTNDDSLYLANLIVAARRVCEAKLDRQLMTATWRMSLDSFCEERAEYGSAWLGIHANPSRQQAPGNPYQYGAIRIPKPPLQSITSITYLDTGGATITLAPSAYIVDTQSEPGRLAPAYTMAWPVTRSQQHAVAITFVAGYASAALVPENIKHAIRVLVAHWYRQREAVSEDSLRNVPTLLDDLLYADHPGSYLP